MRDEFCYMLKRSNAYDWEIVDFGQKEKAGKKALKAQHRPDEYMTISSRGIVHTLDSEETFVSLDEWEREYRIYTKLEQIKFFKNYKLWKNFMLWRKLRRRTNFKKKKAFLENNLFLVDSKLGDPLLEIRSICCDITARANLIDVSSISPKLLPVYEDNLNNSQLRETEWLNQTVNGTIKAKLSESCRVSLNHFKELNRIKNRDGDGSKNGDDKPIAATNDTGKEMPYTQEATIRIHKKKLKKFIRLVDYLVINSKLGMVNNSLIKVDRYLENANKVLVDNVRNNGGLVPTFIIKPDFVEGKLIFIPSIERLVKGIDESIGRGLHYICDQNSMLVNANEFEGYTKIEEVSKDLGPEGTDLFKLISSHETFIHYKDHISLNLYQIFNFVLKQAEDLNPILKIVLKCNNFTSDMIEDKERQTIMDMIEEFVEDDDSIKNITEKYEKGIFSFEREELKTAILNNAAKCLNIIDETLPEIMTRRANEYIKKMQNLNARLSVPVLDVEAFIEHMKIYEDCSNEFDDLSGEYSILQDLALLFSQETYRLQYPEDCRNVMISLKNSKDMIKKLIDDLGDKMDPETVKFKKELTSLIPVLEGERKDVESKLEALEPNEPLKDPDVISVELEPLKKEADSLVAKGEKYQRFQLILNMEVSNIDDLFETKKKITAYYNFWTMKSEWVRLMTKWESIPVKSIDVEEFRNKVEVNAKKINVLNKEIENNDTFKEFKDEMDKAKGILLILEAFAVKALGSGEWEEIKGIIKADSSIIFEEFDYQSDEFFLPQILRMQIPKYKNEISEIAMRAAKERDLNDRLGRAQAFWADAVLMMDNHPTLADIHILANNDELIKRLDTTLVDITNILSNKYVTRIKPEVVKEQQRLIRFQSFIDEICFCQRMWMYLEPIYNSDDNNKELKKESKIFKKDVHKVFTNLTKSIVDSSKYVITKFGKFIPKPADDTLMISLEEIHKHLEELEKKLISYLESKRRLFPRFYFISNDDLIEILSQAKDFEKVQAHMNKMFENIKRLGLEFGSTMKQMISRKHNINASRRRGGRI